MRDIENRMVVDSEWRRIGPAEEDEKLNGPGYEEIGTGIFVPEEDAFNYALERCFEVVPEGVHSFSWTQEFKEMLVEWFYSGNWIGGLGNGRI